MHINSHFAVGVIISSILHYFYNFVLLEFIIIVISSFICDFDVFFSKYAFKHNHRMLISHSIIPSVIIMFFGLIFSWNVLFFSGLVYFIHIIIDTFDWGTNFFYFQKKQVGLKLLISKEEFENIEVYLSKYKKSESFFD
ncbi:MAG: metal-dependent hydrolase, partial [Candidatus Thorarchaeota archaeon]